MEDYSRQRQVHTGVHNLLILSIFKKRQDMFVKKVVDQMEKYNTPYALVGGYSVALHEAVRGTVDVNFFIS